MSRLTASHQGPGWDHNCLITNGKASEPRGELVNFSVVVREHVVSYLACANTANKQICITCHRDN